MPELPEVETVRRGLAPVLTGGRILTVKLRRPDLRFPFPPRFRQRLEGQVIAAVERRAKFLVFQLDSGETWLAHLGMTGRFSLRSENEVMEPGAFYAPNPPSGHEHVEMTVMDRNGARHELIFADPRRFGFMELLGEGEIGSHRRMTDLGPEPLADAFSGKALQDRLAGRRTPIKAALLDQKTVAGLGNIYVCEALFIAGISPRRQSHTIGETRAKRLVVAIKDVLEKAIAAGGSTLRDYAGADGRKGGFQEAFNVYDREGQPCPRCDRPISRIVQSGRSTFFCGSCQR